MRVVVPWRNTICELVLLFIIGLTVPIIARPGASIGTWGEAWNDVTTKRNVQIRS